MSLLDIVREYPGLHIKDLERVVNTRRVWRVVMELESRGVVRTLWVPRVVGGRVRRVKAVFPGDSLDPGLDFLSTWIVRHGDSVHYVDAVEDRGSIIITLHGWFTREEVLDLRYSLGFFGFRVVSRPFSKSPIHSYEDIVMRRVVE